jgi:glycosyltransferase involved in cell wall biosynthesis
MSEPMTEPLVVAVMLTKDRPEMAKRAVECFKKQTYQNKRLYIYDTGAKPCTDSLPDGFPDDHIVYHRGLVGEVVTIGMLRNRANWWAVRPMSTSEPDADILIHWDDDDYSHPNRIAEQVALLQASGKQCVGYRDMLFWRHIGSVVVESFGGEKTTTENHEAWLYHNDDPRYCLGTSLCYWRETWEKRPFKDISRGEDKEFLRDRDTLGVSSLITEGLGAGWSNHPAMIASFLRDRDTLGVSSLFENAGEGPLPSHYADLQSRMIASIHSGNHVVYDPERSPGNYKRVPEWDAYCLERMAL